MGFQTAVGHWQYRGQPMRGLIAALNNSGKYAYKASADATSNHSSCLKYVSIGPGDGCGFFGYWRR